MGVGKILIDQSLYIYLLKTWSGKFCVLDLNSRMISL
jgi:hypothetical protein